MGTSEGTTRTGSFRPGQPAASMESPWTNDTMQRERQRQVGENPTFRGDAGSRILVTSRRFASGGPLPAAHHGRLYCSFRIFKPRIFDSKVDGGRPSRAAAPDGPDTLPLLSRS